MHKEIRILIRLPSIKTFTLMLFASFLSAACLSGCSGSSEKPVKIGNTSYPPETESIVLTDYDSEDYSVFSELKNLHTLDVTALDFSESDFNRLRSQLNPDVNIIWSVPFKGVKAASNTAELTVSGNFSQEDAYAIRFFDHLSRLNISKATVDQNLYNALFSVRTNNPSVSVNCSYILYDALFNDTDELIDLNNIQISSPDQLCLALELFSGIKTVEMCNCGISDEIMQGLREEYPDIKFVWMIHFLNYTVRTDIQVFSTLATNLSRPGNSQTLSPLFKYCTELRALDLGHMALTDISEIRNLKKLHTLILADNRISDISPLADLKELVYIELFFNRFADVSPLLELPNLEDLNLCYDRKMTNATLLTGCKKLKRLYISNSGLSADEIQTLKNGLPADCELNYTASNAVHSGWRTTKNARNTKIREAFKNWRKVKEYPTWDNIIYY
jgi:hypothetical protein